MSQNLNEHRYFGQKGIGVFQLNKLLFLEKVMLLSLVLSYAGLSFSQTEEIFIDKKGSTIYDLADGLSSQCISKTFQDPNGLLWLKSCHYVGRQYNHHFTIFDGD